MSLKDTLVNLLLDVKQCNYSHIMIDKLGESDIEITYGQMYYPPELNFSTLKELSEVFGTDKIDVDNYAECGCDSCDYGSDYGHTIQIYNPTKNVEEAKELFGKNLNSRK